MVVGVVSVTITVLLYEGQISGMSISIEVFFSIALDILHARVDILPVRLDILSVRR